MTVQTLRIQNNIRADMRFNSKKVLLATALASAETFGALRVEMFGSSELTDYGGELGLRVSF